MVIGYLFHSKSSIMAQWLMWLTRTVVTLRCRFHLSSWQGLSLRQKFNHIALCRGGTHTSTGPLLKIGVNPFPFHIGSIKTTTCTPGRCFITCIIQYLYIFAHNTAFGGYIGGQLFNHLCYADDMCLISITSTGFITFTNAKCLSFFFYLRHCHFIK